TPIDPGAPAAGARAHIPACALSARAIVRPDAPDAHPEEPLIGAVAGVGRTPAVAHHEAQVSRPARKVRRQGDRHLTPGHVALEVDAERVDGGADRVLPGPEREREAEANLERLPRRPASRLDMLVVGVRTVHLVAEAVADDDPHG